MATTYVSKKAVERGMKAMKEGASPEVVSEVMKTREVSAEEFFETAEQKEAKKKGPPEKVQVFIPRIEIASLVVKIIGDSPLLVHKWSQKAINQMKAKHARQATAGREVRNPHQEYLDSIYYLPSSTEKKPRYGFPAVAFKKAAVSACTSLDKSDISQTKARQAFHVTGLGGTQLVEITGTPEMQEDSVTVGIDSADLRYRASFMPWTATLYVRFNRNVLSAEQIINILNLAGFAVGVGEWRNEKSGLNGAFHVEGSDSLIA